jgi:glycine/serine hydroxymethyltransferase
MTTRGFGAKESRMVANFIADVFDAQGDAAKVARVGER